MAKDLTESPLERQNILNNRYALEKLEGHLGLGGVYFENELVFTKQQLVEIFGITGRTVEMYLASHGDELGSNGYRVLKGQKLREFKALEDVSEMHFGDKTPAIGIFNFRAMLNLAMVLVESASAREIRSHILDIVIDVIAERTGGRTKYINQRDDNYLPAAYQETNYRQTFTDAIDDYLQSNSKFKYATYTDKVYKLVFAENAKEYKKILNLRQKDSARNTMYAEVLKAIASVENGIAAEMQVKYEQLGRKLTSVEVNELFEAARDNPFLKPIIEDARVKMASRDLCFREALHHKLEAYIQSVPEGDFDRFLGEASRSLEEQLAKPEVLAVFKRLKDK